MRVEAYNQVSEIYKTSKSGKIKSTSSVSSGRDEVSISSTGYDYQIAKQAIAEAPDIREDRVAELKAKVDSNTYTVDSGDFARKLLEKYNTSLL